jgi:D-beta-D-heptose 7-phosphate kinase/D-beta-D-heptose 1-phosphate adenosyltransferase
MIINPYDKKAMRAAQLYCLEDNKIVGLTSGTFDLFHDYHLRYLERCRRLCDVLIVGVDSDRHVKERKGPDRPVLSEFQRVMLIDSNKHITFCYIQDSLDFFIRVAEILLPINGKIFRNQEFERKEDEVVKGTSESSVIIVPDVDEPNSTSILINKVNRLLT